MSKSFGKNPAHVHIQFRQILCQLCIIHKAAHLIACAIAQERAKHDTGQHSQDDYRQQKQRNDWHCTFLCHARCSGSCRTMHTAGGSYLGNPGSCSTGSDRTGEEFASTLILVFFHQMRSFLRGASGS